MNGTIKILALVLMVIDHVGIIFFYEYPVYRWIGRACFPLFAFGIAQGYQLTRNKDAYLERLMVLAIISQIPYSLAFHSDRLNIFFTLSCGLLAVWAWDRKHYWAVLLLVLVPGYGNGILFDYGGYGVALVLWFHLFGSSLLPHSLLAVLASLVNPWQIFSLFALPVLWFSSRFSDLRLPRWLGYWFYPAHFVGLILIRKIIV